MRTVICVVTFIVLLLAGFLATPGVFKVVNPEYLLALREYGQQLTKLAQDATNTDLKMTELRSNISKLERSMKDSSAALAAKQASMKLANASADEIATVTIEAASKLNGLGSEIEQLNTEMAAFKETKAGITSTQAELKKKLDTAAADSANIYVVARALALGAIGALMSIFAKYLAGPAGRPLFEDSTSLGRMWASIAMGGIVSVVVVGLFFTGFISIFANSAQTTGETDFWKVTILCLLAGAFSDRLFQAASGRMDSYLRTGGAEKTGQPNLR
jgi:prefoldin subunit 5